MLLNARKLWREGNNTQHILLAMEDITERKRAEEDLVRSNEDLQSFAYIAAHDLRSPLNSGLNLLQLVLRKAKDSLHDEHREMLNLAVESFQRLGTLMQDILAFAVAGNAAQRAIMMNLEEPLNSALQNLHHHIADTGATVGTSTLPVVHADPTQMVMVFQNLIGNAIKYSRDEPPRVRVEADREGAYWRISVSDNGQGFEREHAVTIFEAFKRLHGTDVPGSGIGLATCKRVIERLARPDLGRVTPGVGSTFHFTLRA